MLCAANAHLITIERSEIVLLWCSDSFTKRVLVSFSCRNFSHTLNTDRIVTKPEKMDKATQGLHGHKVSLRSDKNSRSYKHFNTDSLRDPAGPAGQDANETLITPRIFNRS